MKFVEDYIKIKGKEKSKETILSELEDRQTDWRDEEVKRLLERFFLAYCQFWGG